MTKKTLFKKLEEIYRNEANVPKEIEITPQTDLDTISDSLDRMVFAYNIEDEFGISIEDEEIASLKTFQEYGEYLKKKI